MSLHMRCLYQTTDPKELVGLVYSIVCLYHSLEFAVLPISDRVLCIIALYYPSTRAQKYFCLLSSAGFPIYPN